MRLTLIGAGYVGLVSSACFSELGHIVTCIDTDEDKIKSLSQGKLPIYEPGLETLLKENLDKKRIFFTTDWSYAIPHAEVIFIAVGTPTSRRGNGYADLSYVYEAVKQLAAHLKDYAVIVVKSTIPLGTTRQISRILRETNSKANFDVASNPEFLREGEAIQDFMHPDRIVLGVESPQAQAILSQVYHPLTLSQVPILFTNLEGAELIKYASNAFLATKISFINEMANLCEGVGVDVLDLAKGMGLDQRIGPKFLHAGPGYGGSCFPKDTLALIRIAQEHGTPTRIVETVVEVNNAQRAKMVRKIREALGGDESGKILAVLGLTFKAETDDMREAPSLSILPPLIEKGLKVRNHDPMGIEEAAKLLTDVEYVSDPYQACEGADAVVLMTAWNSYRVLDLKRVKKLLKKPVFIDLQNVYQPEEMKNLGFNYFSVGRKTVYGHG